MKVSITENTVTYTLNNLNKKEVTVGTATLKDGYAGGRLGIMTYGSKAVFSNIKVNDVAYGTVEHDENGFAIRGLSGDSHTVNEALGTMTALTYEADVAMNAGQSAALTFGIRIKTSQRRIGFLQTLTVKKPEYSMWRKEKGLSILERRLSLLLIWQKRFI